MKKWLILFVWAASAASAYACSLPEGATDKVEKSPLLGPSYNAIVEKQKQNQPISTSDQALLEQHEKDEQAYYVLARSTRPFCVHRAADEAYTSCELKSCQAEYDEKQVKFSKDGKGYRASAEEIAKAQQDMDALKKKWSAK